MNDLKNTLKEHLDDALPTADERRMDLQKLAQQKKKAFAPAFAAAPAAALIGLVVGGVAGVNHEAVLRDVGALVAPAFDDTTNTTLRVLVDGQEVLDLKNMEPLTLVGDDPALPTPFAMEQVGFYELGLDGFSFAKRLVDDVPGLRVRADACVQKQTFDLEARFVPAQSVVVGVLDALGWEADVEGGVLLLWCRGAPRGAQTEFHVNTVYPPRDGHLDVSLDVVAQDLPLDALLAQLAKQANTTVRSTTKRNPRVTLHATHIRLETALVVLNETLRSRARIDAGDDATVRLADDGVIEVAGPDSPPPPLMPE